VTVETSERPYYLGKELIAVFYTTDAGSYWPERSVFHRDFVKNIEFRNVLCCGAQLQLVV